MQSLIQDPRQQRGLALSSATRLKKIVDSRWLVPSQSHAGSYLVDLIIGSCTCPDHELRGSEVICKHRWAVEFARHRVEVSEEVKTTVKKPTYPQDWKNYTKAQKNEKDIFMSLLRPVCDLVPEEPYEKGRPKASLPDSLYQAALKGFCGLSGRRVECDLKNAQRLGYISKVFSHNTIFQCMQRPDVTPILEELVQITAKPLAAIETDFAIDGTGFASSVKMCWHDHKHGRERKEAKFVKLHAVVGTRTNVIARAVVTDAYTSESPLLPSLIQKTSETFRMKEVSADKGYLSYKNLNAIEAVGAVPFIAFKDNSRAEGPDAWERAHLSFTLHRKEWLDKYHKRSNVESTFGALKKKFASSVRAKTERAMINEVLVKCICYNISCLIHAMFELGLQPDFAQEETLS